LIPAPSHRGWSVAVTLLALLLSLSACGGPTSLGDGPPSRIVSLVPTATETLFALGAGDLVVGRSAFCDYPAKATEVPAVADALSAGAERILALRPDLILVGSDAQKRALGALTRRVPVRKFIADDLAGVRRSIAELGALIGRESRAEVLLAEIDAAFDRVRAAVADRGPVSVLFVVQHEPLRVAGGKSHISELLAAVGATNVAAKMERPWPELSAETLVRWNPEVILDGSFAPEGDDAATLAFWDRFVSLSAVRNGRVHRMDEPAVVRPGPRLPVALEYLKRMVWGEGR